MSEANLIPYVALGAAAVTGLSTVFGVVIANRASLKQLALRLDHESEKDRNEARRIRLEELYTLIEKWAISIVAHHITYRQVMNGELTYNQALDITNDKEPKFDTQRLFTLAELYFPESHQPLEKIKTIRDEAADIQSDFKELYRHTGSASPEHACAVTEALQKFNAAIKIYKSELATYVKLV